ncbi:hypothetical protein ASPWEDRAFT_582419 [Aspergillus wentii DTO 134E9]|uniref:Uncharacterized protein n=1 Tax=Aspergillus wentii DTO 134E9 TaxID=1073089 RepID=A0A1L9RHS2_ASPWE|nr:uncharacterized protein ASPWEDRAFT_582419 [Aspergillus wentii DTO 134E9]OJJ34418.1 hypothetical protein ASPWEDRAFT_582419 [Aspergillus wentii DTO 134E9]
MSRQYSSISSTLSHRRSSLSALAMFHGQPARLLSLQSYCCCCKSIATPHCRDGQKETSKPTYCRANRSMFEGPFSRII